MRDDDATAEPHGDDLTWLEELIGVATRRGLRYVYTIHRAGDTGDDSIVIGVMLAPEKLPELIDVGAALELPDVN